MTVLFVADLHLCEQRPDLTNAFVHFLKETASGSQALYLLGDIFEAWIGDDYQASYLDPVITALQNLRKQGTQLYFQHGNRDFLVGEKFTLEIGATLLNQIEYVQLPSEQALVMHGDQLCTDDLEYQKFRALVRSKIWQKEFLEKSIEQRLEIAAYLRTTSKQQSKHKSNQITDVNPEAVISALEESGLKLLIHGHTHRPATHNVKLSQGTATRIVLGDWDTSLWYIRCNNSGCELIEQSI